MKNYIQHIQAKPAHERRQISMQIAVVITAVIFVVWVSTLGVRLAGSISSGAVAQNTNAASLVAATAAAGSDIQNQFNEVQPTTDDSSSAVDTQTASTSSSTEEQLPSSGAATVLSTEPSDGSAAGSGQ
jgi:hypothetical protein